MCWCMCNVMDNKPTHLSVENGPASVTVFSRWRWNQAKSWISSLNDLTLLGYVAPRNDHYIHYTLCTLYTKSFKQKPCHGHVYCTEEIGNSLRWSAGRRNGMSHSHRILIITNLSLLIKKKQQLWNKGKYKSRLTLLVLCLRVLRILRWPLARSTVVNTRCNFH